MKTSRLHIVLTTCAVTAVSSACSASGVSRTKAKQLIEANERFAAVKGEVPLSVAAFQAGQRAGLWLGRTTAAGMTFWELTSTGREVAAQIGCLPFGSDAIQDCTIRFAKPTRRAVVEVTGIADGSTEPNTKEVEFVWKYKPAPDALATSYRARAILKLFDDGWRAVEWESGTGP